MSVTQPPAHPPKYFLECIDADRKGTTTYTDADAVTATKAFVGHLKWLEARHIKRTQHSDEYLISNVFRKTAPFFADPEAAAYCRSHLKVAIKQLEALLNGAAQSSQSITLALLRQHRDVLRDYVFDLIEIANFLEQKSDPKYTFLLGGKNRTVHSWELYVLGTQLARQSSFCDQGVSFEHKTAQIAAIFVLRQALELRFQRLIAVYPHGPRGETPRLRHDFHFNFIVGHSHHFKFRGFEFKLLRQLYDWCNEIVHSAYQPYAWQTAWAYKLCAPLLAPHEVPFGQRWSIHNGVGVADLAEMQSAFCVYFVDNYDHGRWCFISSTPEAETKP